MGMRLVRIFSRALLPMLAFGAVARGDLTLDIPVFTGGYGAAFYEETARQFEALRPGVKINLYGDPRVEAKVSVRVIDGNYPDATFAPYVPWPEIIRAGKVLDLRPWLDGPNWEGDARWGDTFLPGALDSWRIDDRICGLPFSYSCWTIFYNRALFRAHGWSEPRTWGELIDLCNKIRAVGLAPFSLPGTRWLYPDAFLRAAFHNLAGEAGWRALNQLTLGARLDPRYLRSAALLQRITRQYVLPGWEGETHTGAELAFLQGRAAMTVSGSWFVAEMKGKMPADFELGAMNFPIFPEGAADPTTIQTGADCFFVFATGHPEREQLAVDFLRFLTSRARAEAFVRRTDSPVAVRGVPAAAFSAQMQDTAAMIARAHAAFAMPQVMMQPPALRQALIDQSQLLTTGRITPQQFAERLEAAAASDRLHAADPQAVEMNHPLAGGALLTAVAAIAVWALWRRWRQRSLPRPAEHEAYFGRMRPSVALGFVGPAFLLYGALVLLPGAAAFAWALMRWDGLGPRAWAGLFNFKWLLFESDVFWPALRNNLFLVVVPALAVVPVSLLLAGLIHRGVWGRNAFRAILLFPNLLGGIAATLLWMNAYEPHGGLVNAGLAGLGRRLGSHWLQSFADYPWLAPEHLYTALIPIYLWLACGFNLVLYLAAMEGIDPQLYEAAELDGVPAWRQFFCLTLPLIWEMVAISVVFLVIGGLNAFEMIWLLTSQDPAAGVNTLATLLVSTMFKNFAIGRAAAIAVVMFALVFAASAAVLRLFKREAVD